MSRSPSPATLRKVACAIAWTVLVVLCFIRLDKLGDYPGFLAFGRAAVDDVMVYDLATQRHYRPDFDGPWATWPPGFVPVAAGIALADRLSPPGTVILFRLLNLAGFVLALLVVVEWTTGKRLRHADPSMRLAWDDPLLAFGLLVPVRLMMNNFEHTNVNPLPMGLALLGLRLVGARPWLGGLAFGLGSAIKATPILFLGWLAWRARWKDLAWCSLGCVVGWVLLPMLFVGVDGLVPWWKGWIDALPASGSQDHWMNQSLRSVGITLWGEDAGVKLWLAGSAALLLLVLFALRSPFRDVAPARRGAEAALLFVAITIVSPVAWKAHYVTLGPLAVAIWAMGTAQGERMRAVVLRWSIAFALLLNLTSREVLGRPLAMWLQEHGSVLLTALAMAAVAGWLLWRETREAADPVRGTA